MKKPILILISLILICSCSNPASKIESPITEDQVSYSITLGELRGNISLSTQKGYEKYAFFTQTNEAQIIAGNHARELLLGAGYDFSDPIIQDVLRVLASNGALAVHLPNFVSSSGVQRSFIYVPHPSTTNFTTGLSSSCDGQLLDLNIFTAGACPNPQSCSRGEEGHPYICTCAGYTSCNGCNTSCVKCKQEVMPTPWSQLLGSCNSTTTCLPSKFDSLQLFGNTPIGTWL